MADTEEDVDEEDLIDDVNNLLFVVDVVNFKLILFLFESVKDFFSLRSVASAVYEDLLNVCLLATGLIFEATALRGGGASALWEALMCMFMGRLGGDVCSLVLAEGFVFVFASCFDFV